MEEFEGIYIRRRAGIPIGSALSVVIGTLYLVDIDQLSTREGVKYLRYMDDIIIFCKTRTVLRKVVKELYRILDVLQLTLADAKTYIGKVANGFDFLGYRIGDGAPDSIGISQATGQRFYDRLHTLYEQRAAAARVADYQKRWYQWVTGGLGSLHVHVPDDIQYLLDNPGDLTDLPKRPAGCVSR